MLNNLPIIGWILDVVFKASLSLPFWIVWTLCGIGAKFFYFLPAVYLHPGFWECVGVFMVLGVLNGFVPKFASVSQDNDNKAGKNA